MVNVAARRLHQVIYRLFVHICRAFAGQFFPVFPGGIGCDDTGTVKAVEAHNLDILDFNDIARLNSLAALLRHAPFYPCFHRFFRADKRYRDFIPLPVRSRHAALKDMCCPFCGHMVLMVMCRQHGIHLLKCKRVNDKRNVAQVRLHGTPAAHIGHLVSRIHFSVSVRALSIPAP